MTTRVYVGRLPSHVDEAEIENLFSEYGPIRHLNKKNDYAFIVCEQSNLKQNALISYIIQGI